MRLDPRENGGILARFVIHSRRADRLPVAVDGDHRPRSAVDGERVDATRRMGDAHVFSLSATPTEVRIVSRAGTPAELGLTRDPRLLGVALNRIAIDRGTRSLIVEANDPSWTEGFHDFEPIEMMRWTDGDATLPSDLFQIFNGPIDVVLHVSGTAQYVDDDAVAAEQACARAA